MYVFRDKAPLVEHLYRDYLSVRAVNQNIYRCYTSNQFSNHFLLIFSIRWIANIVKLDLPGVSFLPAADLGKRRQSGSSLLFYLSLRQ
ncbi:MAG: hypothetical protein COW85_03800 [Ignavibacteria bacterium CG22_combo_CG10-13_8_21_14_all_37_15]|nr:MAG: hypothetical protein COW85_03800 [Ignavibacteria bacterium CG22_combo_CG10-13_8_21_14_all_37_15]